MSAPIETAPPAPVPEPVQPAPPAAPTGLLRATAVIATVGVVIALVGFLLLLRPVTTPVQDCGTSLAFLLDGRTNTYVALDDLPEGVTEAEAEDNNANPCRDRVAEQSRPAGIILLVGLTLAIGAAIVELVVRGLAWRRRRRNRIKQ